MSWVKRLFGAASPPASVSPAAPAAPSELESALAAAYPGQTPFLYGAAIAFADGGPDPLDAVSIYWNARGPHWHYVGHGLAGVMGAELTFRLAAKPSDSGHGAGEVPRSHRVQRTHLAHQAAQHARAAGASHQTPVPRR